MPSYELSLRFQAADHDQAERLALAWAGTCRAEYGTYGEVLIHRDGVGMVHLGDILDQQSHNETCADLEPAATPDRQT